MVILSSTGKDSYAYERATKKIVEHLVLPETIAGGFSAVLMGLSVKFAVKRNKPAKRQTPFVDSCMTENRSWIDPG
jgi:hypothetical protein